jgi:carbon monoxide dehydrogenase subunit G
MELTNEFDVDAPINNVWPILIDVERIAPCLPGAQLEEVEGDEFRGVVKVRVGPITAQFKGIARIVEQDDTAHQARIEGSGRGSQGNATANISVGAAENGSTTTVSVTTQLTLTGRVAQFGRGSVMNDVSQKLMGEFATNLGELIESSDDTPASDAGLEVETSDNGTGVRKIHQPEAEAVDLFETAGAPVAKKVVPIVAIVILLLILRRFLRSDD